MVMLTNADFLKARSVEAIGHLGSDLQGDDLINWVRRSPETYVIKTHEPPATNDPAIYIVRDGRSVIVSYFHYLNTVESQRVYVSGRH